MRAALRCASCADGGGDGAAVVAAAGPMKATMPERRHCLAKPLMGVHRAIDLVFHIAIGQTRPEAWFGRRSASRSPLWSS